MINKQSLELFTTLDEMIIVLDKMTYEGNASDQNIKVALPITVRRFGGRRIFQEFITMALVMNLRYECKRLSKGFFEETQLLTIRGEWRSVRQYLMYIQKKLS